MPCPWGHPPLWLLPGFCDHLWLRSPLITLLQMPLPFTCVYSICSCPSPSCVTLHESLFDFTNLCVPVMPRYVFVIQTFALSSDSWLWWQLGILSLPGLPSQCVENGICPCPPHQLLCFFSLCFNDEHPWLFLTHSFSSHPHPPPPIPCIQSITKFPPPKDFWGQFIALSACPHQVWHYHLPQRVVVIRLLTHLPALAMPPLDPSPTPKSEFSKTPTLLHLHAHFQPFCLQKSPHSWRWLTKLTPASLSHPLSLYSPCTWPHGTSCNSWNHIFSSGHCTCFSLCLGTFIRFSFVWVTPTWLPGISWSVAFSKMLSLTASAPQYTMPWSSPASSNSAFTWQSLLISLYLNW